MKSGEQTRWSGDAAKSCKWRNSIPHCREARRAEFFRESGKRQDGDERGTVGVVIVHLHENAGYERRHAKQDVKKALLLRVLAEQNTHIVCRGSALLRESTTAESETLVCVVVFLHELFVFGGEAFPFDGGLGDVVVEGLAAFLERGEIGLRGGFHELFVDLRLLVFGVLDDLLALRQAAFDAAFLGEQGVAFRGLLSAAVLARGLLLGLSGGR